MWAALRAELRGFVLRRVGDPDTADDIVQEVLVRAVARHGSLRDAARLRPWLFQIARNAVVDHFRALPTARARAQELTEDFPARASGSDAGSGVTDLSDIADFTDPRDISRDADNAERRLADCCVGPFVDRLPAPYRQAVTLAELDGLKQREVADRLGISLSGAKSRVQRARRMLARSFHDCCQITLDRYGRVMDYACRQSYACRRDPTSRAASGSHDTDRSYLDRGSERRLDGVRHSDGRA